MGSAVGINILDLAESGKADQVLRDMRVRCLWSPYYLATVVLGYKELVDYLHNVELEGFVQRLLEGSTKQWIEWPRGFFKTTTFTITCGIWFVLPYDEKDTEYALDVLGLPEEEWFARLALHDQDATQLYAFETQANAEKKVTEVKWHFEENEVFRSLFPEIAFQGTERPWTNSCIKIRRAGYGQRSEEGSFEAIGAGGALQSRHYKIVWEDDLVGKKATESDTEMAKTIRWHGLLAGAFIDATKQWRFGISNRWGFFDLNNHVRENEPDFIFHTVSAWDFAEDGTEQPTFPVDGLGHVRYTIPALVKIRDSGSMTRYDFACTPAGSPILLQNWKQKPIEQVKVGEVVIGWVKEEDGSWYMKPSEVKAVGSKLQEVFEYQLASGNKIKCTSDHLWWKGRGANHKGFYHHLTVGSSVFKVYDPPEIPSSSTQRLYDYLGGILDGEGHIPQKGNLTITQSNQCHPQVCKMIAFALDKLKIPHQMDETKARLTGGAIHNFILGGDRSLKIRLLNNCLTSKKADISNNLWMGSCVIGSNGKHNLVEDRVVSLQSIGEHEVFWLETSTGNYINQGYASKNCQYMNRPMLPGEKEIGLAKLHTYIVADDGTMVCNCGAKFKPSQLSRYMHYDPYNAKGVRSVSRPAIAVIGTAIDQHVFLIDYYIGKGNYSKIFDELFHKNDVWRPQLFTYEDVGHQNMCEFHISEITKTPQYQKDHRHFPRILAATTGGKAKEVRIRENLIPVIEHGKFSRRQNQTMFDEMLETFPHSVPGHDYDLLDALAQGAKHWRYPQSEEQLFKEKEVEDAYLQQLGKPYSRMEVRT